MGDSGVILLPPTGYPYLCAHRTLRVLAERLAEHGHTVLRIDYDGTGDSAGDQWDSDRIPAWRGAAHAAAEELTALGIRRIMLAGARLGATFALLDGASLGAERIVAWAPVLSGRRYAKELRLMSIPVPEGADPCDPPGTIVSAGNVFSAQTLSDMRALNVSDLNAPPAPRNLIIDDPSGSATGAAEHLRSLGAEVEHLKLPGGETALETPAEFAVVPDPILDAIVAFLGSAEPGNRQPADEPAVARIAWRGGTVTEELMTLSPHGQQAVCTAPIDPDPARATLVLLNPGSETHVGPGRAWVEYARELALLGHRTVRVDFRGWGESPDDGRAPGRPYDPGTEQDTQTIVDALRDTGHPRLVLAGLCASSWIALRVVLRTAVAGVIALNPQLYWQPGYPIEIDPDLDRNLRAKEIKRHERGARWGVWNLLDVIGSRHQGGRWLDQLAATGMPVTMLFAEGDDGLLFLRTRLARRMAQAQRTGSITIEEMLEVDHPMHRAWLRPRVLQEIHQALDAIDLAARA
jgi:pimeloyl-ACP methyl ester carboxylesterase